METYENIKKFLDAAIQATEEYLQKQTTLRTKSIYHTQLVNLRQARLVLCGEFYTFETWAKTGVYEVPEINPSDM